jgi:hypothetical protein
MGTRAQVCMEGREQRHGGVAALVVLDFEAIAGPTILALMLYWRDNPDQRPSWRRAREHSPDTDPGCRLAPARTHARWRVGLGGSEFSRPGSQWRWSACSHPPPPSDEGCLGRRSQPVWL